MEANGYKVITALQGEEGLEKAKAEKPDLIILDYLMPGMNGFQVIQKLKLQTETQYIPVVMLTCKGETESIFDAKDLGVSDYLIKPFESETLLRVIKRFIG